MKIIGEALGESTEKPAIYLTELGLLAAGGADRAGRDVEAEVGYRLRLRRRQPR